MQFSLYVQSCNTIILVWGRYILHAQGNKKENTCLYSPWWRTYAMHTVILPLITNGMDCGYISACSWATKVEIMTCLRLTLVQRMYRLQRKIGQETCWDRQNEATVCAWGQWGFRHPTGNRPQVLGAQHTEWDGEGGTERGGREFLSGAFGVLN